MIRVWGGKHLTGLLLAYAFAALAGPMVYATSQVLLERLYPTPPPAPKPAPPKPEERPAIMAPIRNDDHLHYKFKKVDPQYDWKGVQYLPSNKGFMTCPSMDPYARFECFARHDDKHSYSYTGAPFDDWSAHPDQERKGFKIPYYGKSGMTQP